MNAYIIYLYVCKDMHCDAHHKLKKRADRAFKFELATAPIGGYSSKSKAGRRSTISADRLSPSLAWSQAFSLKSVEKMLQERTGIEKELRMRIDVSHV